MSVLNTKMDAFQNLRILILFISASILMAAAQNTNSSDICKFGGTCSSPIDKDGGCTCNCVVGFGGALCEIVLTKVSGAAKYAVQPLNEAKSINTSQFQALVRESVSTQYTVTVESTLQNRSDFSISFVFYLERPSSWRDYKDADVLNQNLTDTLSLTSSTQNIFGTTSGVLFTSVKTNVDECASNWTNCNLKAGCVDQDPGFLCVCDIGLQGNGASCSPIFCKLSEAPSPPSLGNRIFSNVNGTVIEPTETFPYATSIEYTCPKRYEMVNQGGVAIGIKTSACQNGGWTPVQYSRCSMNLEFRIALGISIVSALIIVAVVVGFVTHWCLRNEKRAKQGRRTNPDREDMSLERYDWNDM